MPVFESSSSERNKTRLVFQCKNCEFVSDIYSLYQEIPKPMPNKMSQPWKFRTAAPNLHVALSVVLIDTPIGNNARFD